MYTCSSASCASSAYTNTRLPDVCRVFYHCLRCRHLSPPSSPQPPSSEIYDFLFLIRRREWNQKNAHWLFYQSLVGPTMFNWITVTCLICLLLHERKGAVVSDKWQITLDQIIAVDFVLYVLIDSMNEGGQGQFTFNRGLMKTIRPFI